MRAPSPDASTLKLGFEQPYGVCLSLVFNKTAVQPKSEMHNSNKHILNSIFMQNRVRRYNTQMIYLTFELVILIKTSLKPQPSVRSKNLSLNWKEIIMWHLS